MKFVLPIEESDTHVDDNHGIALTGDAVGQFAVIFLNLVTELLRGDDKELTLIVEKSTS